MDEKVKAFYETISADEALREALMAKLDAIDLGDDEAKVRAEMAESVAEFAKEHGYDVTVEDVLVEGPEGELSEQELAEVAGGVCACVVIGAAKGCGCFFAGGASMSDDSLGTACVGLGLPIPTQK